MDCHNLPFDVGHLVETKSFISGYRGCWFRCKILDIRRESHGARVSLEYYDFPDEEIKWYEVYEMMPQMHSRKRKKETKELMIRPSFPRTYHQSQIPNIVQLLEEILIVRDVWKVGDSVDWLNKDCYWSGKVTTILGDEMVKVELPSPPHGEGSSYVALCKDLRPSLNWSLDDGWTIPFTMESNCAWLMKPRTQEDSYDFPIPVPREGRKKRNTTTEKEASDGKSLEQSMSIDALNETLTPVVQKVVEEDVETCPSASIGAIRFNSIPPETIEASIMDMEELLNRFQMAKKIPKVRMVSNIVGPSSSTSK
ncbi:hypothetical protein ACFE04_024595 [Oxalis oulophora]